MFVLITPVCKGNGFRALINGVVVLAFGLLIATNLSPLITTAAINAKYALPSNVTQISSICDGANPLTWAIVRLNNFGWAGMAIVAVVALALALINRKRIAKEAKELKLAE